VSTSPDPRGTWLVAWHARRPWAADALMVAAILALGAVRGPDRAEGTVAWLFTVALAVPLLWRRRWPVGVFAVIALVALGQWLSDTRSFGDSALLVALYTVAATRSVRMTLAAAAVVEVGILLAALRWAGERDEINAFVALSGLATAAGVLGVNVRHRRALLSSLHERAERLEYERDQQGRLAAAAERSRIAREMHDIVAHNLSVMIALADGASFAVHDAPDRAEAAMRGASRTGRQALTEMRRLLGVLREEPATDDHDGPDGRAPQPGLAQIAALVEQVRTAGLPISHTVVGAPPEPAPAGLQLAAYRIVQEALTNTLKHAGPGARATVSLTWDADRLAIELRDTGLTPDPSAAEGAGLRGMRERAAVYDGIVEAGPAPGGGWRVRTELACAPAALETTA
jgi:signal transduction histidine kinase